MQASLETNVIAIIDYEAGNLTSVKRALDHIGAPCKITRDAAEIAAAERVIFPGVGAAASAMASLTRLGLDAALRGAVSQDKPVLGICLGCQIVFERSEEDGGVDCLGLVPGQVVRFGDELTEDDGRPISIPHMGYNSVAWQRPHPVLAGLPAEAEFYFVHSYHPQAGDPAVVVGQTTYGRTFSSVVATGSLVAMQYHPEKSGRPGLKILENFVAWSGKEDQP